MASWDIEFSHLKAGYGDNVVLTDVSGKLPGGAVSVILGGSGCGKSTLLRQIIGLSHPMGGEIRIGGLNLLTMPGSDFRRMRRSMGVLFQDGAMLGALTLAENVCLPLSEHLRLTKQELRTEAIRVLRMVGLGDFADYYPNELSGGMRKRAGLARALALDPAILFLDEPSAGLDPVSAKLLDDLISELRDALGTTFVIVSHELASIYAIATNSIFLDAGTRTMQACGNPSALVRDPSTPEAAMLFLTRGLSRHAGEIPDPRRPDITGTAPREGTADEPQRTDK